MAAVCSRISLFMLALSRIRYGSIGLNEENILYSYKIKYECLIYLPYSKTNAFLKLCDIKLIKILEPLNRENT